MNLQVIAILLAFGTNAQQVQTSNLSNVMLIGSRPTLGSVQVPEPFVTRIPHILLDIKERFETGSRVAALSRLEQFMVDNTDKGVAGHFATPMHREFLFRTSQFRRLFAEDFVRAEKSPSYKYLLGAILHCHYTEATLSAKRSEVIRMLLQREIKNQFYSDRSIDSLGRQEIALLAGILYFSDFRGSKIEEAHSEYLKLISEITPNHPVSLAHQAYCTLHKGDATPEGERTKARKHFGKAKANLNSQEGWVGYINFVEKRMIHAEPKRKKQTIIGPAINSPE